MTLAWLLAACSGGGASPPPDVLLVTLDTTRADRIGVYGYAGAATPTLDALAARGRRYDRAYSTVPLTIPSHASLFTGRYPSSLQVRANGDAALSPGALTLAERLQDHGYTTAASVGAFVTTRVWGFDQGFDLYLDSIPGGRDGWQAQRPGSEVVDDLITWEQQTREQQAPRFAWAHLYDPHHPYVPWPEHVEAVGGRPYDAELAYVDAQVARLVAAFDRRETLVVVVGDHGEALGEHGEASHGLFVYDATQRVPWIVAGPGVAAGQVVDPPVSLVDVAPTILSLLGLPPLPTADGRVVPGEPRPVFVESWQLAQRFGLAPHLGVVDGDFKLIGLPRPELYDVVTDPGEADDLSATHPEVVARLQAVLADAAFEAPRADPAHAPSPELAAQLAQLGYVDAGVVGVSDGPRPDPKQHRDLIRQVLQLDHRVQRPEDDPETLETLRGLVVRYPHITELRTRMAAVLMRMGRHDDATSVVRGALERDPDNLTLRVGLATQLTAQGRYAEAAELYRDAAEAMPWQPRLKPMALLALIDSGRPAEGAALGQAWLQDQPGDAAVAGLTGVSLVKAGRFEEALPLLELGLQADPPERDVAYHLSAARMGAGDLQAATDLLDLELAHHPGHLEALSARANLYARTRDWSAQLDLVERAVAVRPESSVALHLQSQTLYNLQRFDEARAVLDRALRLTPDLSALLLLDANLMRQEGKPDAAAARFEQAQAARAREEARGAPPP